MEYPESWKNLFDYHWQTISTANVDVFNEQTYDPNQKTISLIFKMPQPVTGAIADKLTGLVPAGIKDRIIFPDPESYHFTVQWAPDESKHVLTSPEILGKLGEIFSGALPIEGELHFPFFGRANLYGLLRTEEDGSDLKELRVKLQNLLEENGIGLGIKPDSYELAWTSLLRFNGTFIEAEKLLLKNLPVVTIPNVTLEEVSLVRNDKMNQAQYSQTLKQFKLGR